MQIIDVHVHALPRGDMDGGKVDARLETVLEGLRQKGIRKAVLVPINDLSYQPVNEMNDFTVQVVRQHREIVGFVDTDISQAHYYRGIQKLEADVSARHEQGLRGVKVHLQNLGVQASDWRLLPLYRLAGELGIPVMIHCHAGSCRGTVSDSSPVEIEKVVRAFHKTTFMVAHFGGILYFEYMPWLNHDNVYFDTSGIMVELMRYYGVDRVRYILEEIGYAKILFGSDHPAVSLDEQLEAVGQIVPKQEHDNVFAANALRFGQRFGWWDV